ncbi:hypothetical protein OG21DRAFT_166869 [Imleria badia]|nr:hypothetical protein OG21DRAFT_166869 [Imleria badia]
MASIASALEAQPVKPLPSMALSQPRPFRCASSKGRIPLSDEFYMGKAWSNRPSRTGKPSRSEALSFFPRMCPRYLQRGCRTRLWWFNMTTAWRDITFSPHTVPTTLRALLPYTPRHPSSSMTALFFEKSGRGNPVAVQDRVVEPLLLDIDNRRYGMSVISDPRRITWLGVPSYRSLCSYTPCKQLRRTEISVGAIGSKYAL